MARKLSTEIKLWKYQLERIAHRLGLSFPTIIYEPVSQLEMAELVAYGGFPVRYRHWHFGQEFLGLRETIKRGSVFYEIVIHTDPCYAYLLETNDIITQKTVMAHVCGHADFFRNNAFFRTLSSNMHNTMADNANAIERIREKFGRDQVDRFIEAAMSLDTAIDLMGAFFNRAYDDRPEAKKKEIHRLPVEGLPSYMDDVLNPPEAIAEERKRLKSEEKLEAEIAKGNKIPVAPVRDMLGFIARHASLEPWQREIVRIIRDENLFFLQGAQTKIMNEGWASLWEHRVMLEAGAVLDSELQLFAKQSAGVLRNPLVQINPYYLGLIIWKDVWFRWDTGRHGVIYDECPYVSVRERWDDFAVLKSLLDRYGEEDAVRRWRYYRALISETHAGRGSYPAEYFMSDQYVTEWLLYSNVETLIAEAQAKLERVREFEVRLRGREGASEVSPMFWFQAWHHAWIAEGRPDDLFWASEELERLMGRYERILSLKHRIESGEVVLEAGGPPAEWIIWAKFSGPITLGAGKEKVFEVRRTHSDVTFIDDFFTDALCEREGYNTLGIEHNVWNDRVSPQPFDAWIIKSQNGARVRAVLKRMLRNVGLPQIEVVDANWNGNRELYVTHLHYGRDLDPESVREVLPRLWTIWGGKPVHLETLETKWPKKRNWWETWRPGGGRSHASDEPKRTKVLYSCTDGKKVDKKTIN